MTSHTYPMTYLGEHAFNHSTSSEVEAEYDRLRGLATQEAKKRSGCFDKAHIAHNNGGGAAAHAYSQEGKAHAAKMDAYNKQASDYIFRENNAPGGIADNTIDLHGQFVEEAERILENRIRRAQSNGQSGLHVIVGKGNHSANHIQKIEPCVEQICQEMNLQYVTEQNEGRMYINLQGGPAVTPPTHGNSGQYKDHHLHPHRVTKSSKIRIQTPKLLVNGSDIDGFKNTARNGMQDLFTRIERRNPEVQALEMHGLSGIRELDMLSDGRYIILISQSGLAIIDNDSFLGYYIGTEELLTVDWPLSGQRNHERKLGDHRILHAAYNLGLMIIISEIEGASSYISLSSYSIDVKLEEPLMRVTPPHLPHGLHPSDIVAVAISKDQILIAHGLDILVWNRTDFRYITTLVLYGHNKKDVANNKDHFSDIMVRERSIVATTRDGQVAFWDQEFSSSRVEARSQSPKLDLKVNSVSMSRDEHRVVVVDYPQSSTVAYLESDEWKTIPARDRHPHCKLRIDEYCDAVALSTVSDNKAAITPHFDFYSLFKGDQPLAEVEPLGTGFPQYLGQYIGFMFGSHSIIYFGSMGVIRLDYRIDIEKTTLSYPEHSSRYIPLASYKEELVPALPMGSSVPF